MQERKIYPIQRSPLYRLRSKRKLAGLLGVSVKDLHELAQGTNYNVFTKRKPGKKDRLVEEPVGCLRVVHDRLQCLLSRIQAPDELFSGKKGISALDNSKYHLGQFHSLTLDIAKFFPSCRDEYIFRFFRHRVLMSDDTARLLTLIVTREGHVPTGSPLSMSIAYWGYSEAFENICKLARSYGIRPSLYVDDMTFSSSHPISRGFMPKVNHILKRADLHLNRKKTRYHSARYYKVVTGAAISPSAELKVPNRIRFGILNALHKQNNIDVLDVSALESLQSRIASARRIEPTFLESTYHRIRKALANQRRTRSINGVGKG